MALSGIILHLVKFDIQIYRVKSVSGTSLAIALFTSTPPDPGHPYKQDPTANFLSLLTTAVQVIFVSPLAS